MWEDTQGVFLAPLVFVVPEGQGQGMPHLGGVNICILLLGDYWVGKGFDSGPISLSLPTNLRSFIFAQEPIRLRYKLTFNQGGQPFSEVGEVKDFPDLAVLGAA